MNLLFLGVIFALQLQGPQTNIPPGSPLESRQVATDPIVSLIQAESTFSVSAVEQLQGNTVVTMNYPKGLGEKKLWTCFQMSREQDLDNEKAIKPLWCWFPSEGDQETYVVPRWPAPEERTTIFYIRGFVQWLETPDQHENFAISEAGWVKVRK